MEIGLNFVSLYVAEATITNITFIFTQSVSVIYKLVTPSCTIEVLTHVQVH